MNVVLRLATADDRRWLVTWLPPVAKSVGYDAADDAEVRIIERDSEPAGVLVVRMHAPAEGSAIVELVATPKEQARRGSAMQACVLLEGDLRSQGVARVYAPAPAAHGIAMYFWIRLGYRPLLRDDWPCAPLGVAWLRRDIGEGQTNGS